MLTVIGSFIGIFFIPAVGKLMDKYGVKKMLYFDALSFIGVYFIYGLLSMGYVDGSLKTVGFGVSLLAYIIFIIDRMSTQMGIVRTVYLRKIAVVPEDVTPNFRAKHGSFCFHHLRVSRWDCMDGMGTSIYLFPRSGSVIYKFICCF